MIERHKKDIWKICIWYLGRNENHQADVSKTVVKSWPALGEVVADDPVYISYDRFDLWSLTIIYTFLPGFQEFFSIFMIPENLALHDSCLNVFKGWICILQSIFVFGVLSFS